MNEARLRELAREMMDGQSSLCRYYGREVLIATLTPNWTWIALHKRCLDAAERRRDAEASEMQRRILEQQGDGCT
jgi:hypothetical protein